MVLKIKWSKRADKRFDKILEYLSLKFGEKVTKAFVRKTYDFLDLLIEFPQIGTLENRENGIRGYTLIKQVNLFYKIRKNHIIILDFFDNRSDPTKKRF